MASFDLILPRYRALVQKLFPLGSAWRPAPGSVLDALWSVLAQEPARVEARAWDLIAELDPAKSFELLDDWERLLGLPDECGSDTLSIPDRRARVLQKLGIGGGQSEAFFRALAATMGFVGADFDIVNFRDARAGRALAGDLLTNNVNPDGSENDNGWRHAFQVTVPTAAGRPFRAGASSAGDPLVIIGNAVFECVMRKFVAAHATIFFAYVE